MYGRTLLNGNNTVLPTRVSADGSPIYKSGGVTIDWTTVAATGTSVTTLPDGSTIAPATKFLRYGQPLAVITGTGTNNTGYYGPHDPAASDGRQTTTKGGFYILDQTVLQYGIAGSGVMASNDNIGTAIEGGRIFVDRVLNSGTSNGSLSTGVAMTNLASACPNFTYVKITGQ